MAKSMIRLDATVTACLASYEGKKCSERAISQADIVLKRKSN